MRLIELKFAALGPFAGEHRIRFADFEASGLFLLRGPTGSGKSAIIDAVLFALYADAPLRETSSAARLRSNFASADTLSYAELLFEVPSGAYLVRRCPRYTKPGNKNATAATAVLEKVQLVDDQIVGREPLAAKPAEVNPLIVEIIGIAHHQFLQTVVLPQGKFAEFVRASADSRKQLLQQIFKTEQFDRFTEALKEKAKIAKADFEALETQAKFIASSIVNENVTELGVAELMPRAKVRLAQLEVASTALKVQHRVATADRQEATFLVKEVSEMTKLQTQFLEVSKQRDNLAQQAPKFAALEDKALQAQEASPVVAEFSRLTQLETKVLESQTLIGNKFAVSVTDETLGTTQAQLEVLNAEVKQLESFLTQLKIIDSKQAQTQALETKLGDTEATIAATKIRLEQAKEPMANLKNLIDSLLAAAESIPVAETELTQVQQRLEASRNADVKRQELVACADQIGLCKRQLAQANRDYERAWLNWKSSVAAQLAQQLEAGEACAVCGSTEHPRPAVVDSDFTVVSTEQLGQFTQAVSAAAIELELQRSQQAQLTAEITTLNQTAQGHTAQLEDLEADCLQRLRVLETQVAQAEELQLQYEAAQGELRELENSLLADKVRVAETAQAIQQLREETQALAQSIETSTANASTLITEVETQLQVARQRQENLQSLLAALHQLSSYTQLTQQTQEKLEQLLVASSFTSIEQAQAAVAALESLPDAWKQIATYQAQRAQVEEKYQTLKAVTQSLGKLPSVEAAKRLYSHVEGRLEQVNAQVSATSQQLLSMHRKVSDLEQTLTQLEAHEASSGYLLPLAQLASGAKTAAGVGIPLSTWVLMERFEAVIAAANPFIARFSNSRFKLVRVDEDGNSSAAQHGGLGISVYDNETDRSRPSKSLSGGETFYVSLALALGLAEVVSAEAGGIDFKSMLIDEGFGTLDPQTLDKVLEGLKLINHSGRTIGIVSHVEELRRRISDGIEVLPNPGGGSTLKVYS